MAEVFIYALKCPDSFAARYVGKTIHQPEVRLVQHLCDPTDNRRTRWLAKLARAGKRPTIEVLEITTEELWQERERFWIAHFRATGCDLVNLQDGGQGASPTPPETHCTRRPFSLPPALWAEIRALIPRGERSRLVREMFEREVKRRRRATRDLPPP